FQVLAYVTVSVASSFVLGLSLTSFSISTGKGTSIVSEHGWLYLAVRSTRNPVTYPFVHVLTSACHRGKHLMYFGQITRFGLRADGRFAYLVLGQAAKYSLDLATEDLKTSKEMSAIKGDGIGTEFLYID